MHQLKVHHSYISPEIFVLVEPLAGQKKNVTFIFEIDNPAGLTTTITDTRNHSKGHF